MRLLSVKDAIIGSLIYALGDSVAALLAGEFQTGRMLGMLVLGGTLYAIEIPAWFRWISRRYSKPGVANAMKRMLMAVAFFNPLWIARHLLFIRLLAGQGQAISWELLLIASQSFVYCLPVALPINYWIQNNIPLSWRFFASSIFSAVMAVYFSLSEVLFG